MSYTTANFCGDYYVLVKAELLLQLRIINRKDLSLIPWFYASVFSDSEGNQILFCKNLCAIFYGWEELHLSVVYPGQHVWKLQCDERASRKGKRGTKNTAKGIRKNKKRGNLLLWCNSEDQICFLSSFLTWLFFFLPGFNTFTKQGSLWSAEPKCTFDLSVKWWIPQSFVVGQIFKRSCIPPAHFDRSWVLDKDTQNKLSAVAISGQAASLPSLGVRRSRRQ